MADFIESEADESEVTYNTPVIFLAISPEREQIPPLHEDFCKIHT
jgi:hypothetical protein